MKRIEIIPIKAKDDKALVQEAFNEYFKKPNEVSAIKVVYYCAMQMMVGTPIKTHTLVFDKLSAGTANYKDGKITISLKTLKKCKKPEHLVEILISLFHEFSHALVEYNNKQILASQKNGEYIVPYFDGFFYGFFKRITDGDLELASACSMYYYILNKDEDMARKFSVDMANKYIAEYCPDKGLVVKTHQQLNDRLMRNLYGIHRDLIYNRDLPVMVLNHYQHHFVEKLVKAKVLTNDEIKDFLLSLELKNTPEMRGELIKYIVRAKDFEQAELVLSNPLIKVTEQELQELRSVYGNKQISKLVFGEFKITQQVQEASK